MKIAFFVAGMLFGWLLEWIVYLLFFKNRQQQGTHAAAESAVSAPAEAPVAETTTPAAEDVSEPIAEADVQPDELVEETVADDEAETEDAAEDNEPADQDMHDPEDTGEVAEDDDLTLIKGIGPKLSESLAAVGVTTFKALEKLSEEELLAKFEASGVKLVNAGKIDTFAEQASLAAKGQWDDLKTLQKTL